MSYFLKRTLFSLGIASVVILSTSGACDSSGSGSGSSGGGSQTITNDAIYTFESVNLRYDFSSKHNAWNDMYYDASELYVAHDVDPTKLSGTITRLNRILLNENNYPTERKPEIKVTINPAGYDPVIHICSANDIGENFIGNLPNYGVAVNSLIVSVKSITTSSFPAHGLSLCWSKSFDLNQEWWDFYGDQNLNGNASVTVLGYTKSSLDGDIVLLRRVGGINEYQLVTYGEDLSDLYSNNGVFECDVEFLPPNNHNNPHIWDAPIFIEDGFDNNATWNAPEAATIIIE